jgi:outer membrane protein assembly factor BamB
VRALYYGETIGFSVTRSFTTIDFPARRFGSTLNGPIYAGPSLIGDSILYAIATGDAVYRLDNSGNTVYNLQVGGEIRSSCSISHDTVVYITSSDRNLYAFSKTGAPVWPAIPLGGVAASTPTVDSVLNRLYVGVSNRNFFGINRYSGTVSWNFLADGVIDQSAVLTVDRRLIFSTMEGTMNCIDLIATPNPTAPTWSLSLGDTITSSPALDQFGNVYVGTKNGKIVKLMMNRTVAPQISWIYQTGGMVTASPVIDREGSVYVGSTDGSFYALMPETGEKKWQIMTSAPVRSTATISSGGVVYFANDLGHVFAVSPEGVVRWAYEEDSPISAALLYNRGVLFLGKQSGELTAVNVDTGTSVESLGGKLAIWGTFQGNNRRTGVQNPEAIVSASSDKIVQQPASYSLFQNYPNPLNPTTVISYQLPVISRVSLKVFDILGREVAVLVNEEKSAGTYRAIWDANGMPSGVYFYLLTAGSFTETKKLVLMR